MGMSSSTKMPSMLTSGMYRHAELNTQGLLDKVTMPTRPMARAVVRMDLTVLACCTSALQKGESRAMQQQISDASNSSHSLAGKQGTKTSVTNHVGNSVSSQSKM